MSRKTKPIRRRQGVYDLDVKWAFINDRLPLYAESLSICSCGRRAWLMPGATEEDRDRFYEDDDDHLAACGWDMD